MIISDGKKIKVQNYGLYPISANKIVLVKGKTIILADPTDPDITHFPLAITLESFEVGSWGEVLLSGSLLNVNTNAYSSFTNTILYLTTNGVITATPGNVSIGSISKLSDTAGEIFINFSIDPTVTWGNITGTLSEQTDLQAELDAKVPYTGAIDNVDLGEYELKAGQVELDQTPTGTFAVAKMRWNDTDGVPEVRLKGGNVTGQMFLENLKRVVNKTGGDLLEANYQVVRIRTVAEGGAAGQRLAVKLAMADSDANSATTIGVVTETILHNQEGFINIGGEVKEIDTTGTLQGESWNEGDILYLSGTVAGQLTNIKPAAPTHTIIVAFVSYKHAIHGKIDVKVDNGYELDELHNVKITTPLDAEVLTYDDATSLWINSALPAKQDPITLTTTGTSGAATLVGATLNIPQYSGGSVARSFMGVNQNATVASSGTTYGTFIYSGLNTGEASRIFVVPYACTMKNFYVRMFSAQSATGSLVFTLRKNLADTSVVVTIAAGSAAGTEANSNSSSATYAAGDDCSIKVVNNATVLSGTINNTSIMIEI